VVVPVRGLVVLQNFVRPLSGAAGKFDADAALPVALDTLERLRDEKKNGVR
jgi:hypothetical protein